MNLLTRFLAGIRSVRIFSAKDMLWQYAANFGVAAFGALFILALGKFLGARDFGIYAIAAATPAVVNAIFDFRFQEISIVLMNKKVDLDVKSRDIKTMYYLDILSKFVALVISVFSGFLVMRYYGLDQGIEIPAISSLCIFLSKAGNSTTMGLFRQLGHISIYAILQSADWALRLIILIIFYYKFGMDVERSFYIQIIPAFSLNAASLAIGSKMRKQHFGPSSINNIIKTSTIFIKKNKEILLSSQAISSVDSVVKELDTLICGAFLLPQDVAVYKMAKNISSIAWKMVDPIFVLILPGISKYIGDGKINDMIEIIKRSMTYLIGASLVVFFSSWLGASIISQIILGQSYQKIPLVYPLISLWIIVALPFIWTHSVAIASGQAPVQALAGAIGNLVGLVALVIGVITLGIYGAALGLSVAFAAPFALSFYLLRKKKIIRW